MKNLSLLFLASFMLIFSGCELLSPDPVNDPATAEEVVVDRFSNEAATLHVRNTDNDLPGPGEAIDFDVARFLATGLGPDGEIVQYYDFDVQPLTTAPLWVFQYESTGLEVPEQLNVIDVIPGEEGYSDFWHMNIVKVPDDYVANTISSYEEIIEEDYEIEATNLVVNCPVVPPGSSATLRYKDTESKEIHTGWYKKKLVSYFTFEEKEILVNVPETGTPLMPISGIMVTFNINPDLTGGGPPSGFVTEPGSAQTHNVLETLPEDNLYSPLWVVDVYDNADFDNVSDWASSQAANILATSVMYVNCPVVKVGPAGSPNDVNSN